MFTALCEVLLVNIVSTHMLGHPAYIHYLIYILSGLAFLVVFLLLVPHLIRLVERSIDYAVTAISKLRMSALVMSTMFLVVGLIIGKLLGYPLSRIGVIGPYLSITSSLIFGYAGILLGYRKSDDFLSLFMQRNTEDKAAKSSRKSKSSSAQKITASPKILDTSVIIDGRIADIYRSGFLEGDLIVAGFVLDELRHIADSSDTLKRNRGRGGLDCLNAMREEFASSIVIEERDYPDLAEVDSKLVKLAQDLRGVVVTNDFNLNKVARLQEVKVLNINELSNAVKPVVLPGETMHVTVVKEGKEAGQGVAYLDDGTMIVIENGRRYIGHNIPVMVTSILQTHAGRMVFVRPLSEKEESQLAAEA